MARRRDVAAFTLAAAAFWVGLGSYGLLEPSDARYAEIAREMWVSGDFLWPRFLGLHHFHKPPLLFWLVDGGYALLGVNEWGARACLGALGLLLCGLVWRFARRHLGRDAGPWIPLCLATTPAVVGAARMLTTDLLLATCVVAAATSWYDLAGGDRRLGTRLTFYVGAGLAFLAKGPVGWLLLALLCVPTWLARRREPRVATTWGAAWGVPLALAIALPWYALVALETPGLASYFLGGQLASRFRETGMGHPHGWHYYLLVFPALGLPWILFAVQGWRRVRRRDRLLALFLGSWAVAPPLFFTLPATKLPLYPLAAYPALALLAAVPLAAPGRVEIRLLRVTGALLAAASGALLAVGAGFVRLRGGDLVGPSPEHLWSLLLAPTAVLGAAAIAVLALAGRRPGAAAALAAGALAFLPAWGFSRGDVLPACTARQVGLAARAELRPGDVLVNYRDLAGGLPFYAGSLPLVAGIPRETQFESARAASRVMSRDDLHRLWTGQGRVLLVAWPSRLREFPDARILARGGGYALLANR